jgi:hypothetical protein
MHRNCKTAVSRRLPSGLSRKKRVKTPRGGVGVKSNELEQCGNKPEFYTVLGISVNMPVFNGGDSASLTV